MRQFKPGVVAVNEIAVVQGLQAEVGKLQVAFRCQRFAECGQIVQLEFRVQQFEFDAALYIAGQCARVERVHITLGGVLCHAQERQRFGAKIVQQQACRRIAVVGFLFYECARSDDQGSAQLCLGHAVVEVFQCLVDNFGLADIGEPRTGFLDDGIDARNIERRAGAVGLRDVNADMGGAGGLAGCVLAGLFGTHPGVLLAINDVVAGYLVLTGAHQRQFHLVLYILYMNRATGGHAALERRTDLICQLGHGFMDARGRRRRAAFNRQERLGDSDRDLAVVVRHHGSVALDHPDLSGGSGGDV